MKICYIEKNFGDKSLKGENDMAKVSRVYVEEIQDLGVFRTGSFTYRICIKDVPGFAENNMARKSIGVVREAAIVAGKALGFPVFDGTDGGKEIWTPPKQKPRLVYPLRRGER